MMTDKEKTNELIALINALCSIDFPKNQETINEWIKKLGTIYSDGYRHSYSDIFSEIQRIISDDSTNDADVLDILGENLNVLGDKIEKLADEHKGDDNIQDTAFGYKKFSDHIRLEIGRYNFIKTRFEKSIAEKSSDKTDVSPNLEQIKKLEKAVDAMRPTVTQAQKQLDNLDEKLESNKISSITTLTIFSAVILAFSGGITFESGVFKGMTESSPYRLVFTVALSGFILFNTIFALLYLVAKMAGKQISTRCKYLSVDKGECTQCQICGNGYCTKECADVSIACKIIHKYSYVLAVNAVLLYFLYTDFFLWVSKGVLSDPKFYLSQVALGVLFIATLAGNYIHKCILLNRIKLHYKVDFLEEIVEPDKAETSWVSRMLETLNRSVYGTSARESYVNKIKDISNKSKDKDEALKYLEVVIDDYLNSSYRTAIFVSRREHKANVKKWKELKEKVIAVSNSSSSDDSSTT